jgi:hypothetical protein
MTSTELPLVDYLNSPRPEMQKNWKGEDVRPDYPKGQTLARCGDVFLIRQSEHHFAVVYALFTMKDLSQHSATVEFGACCIHQARNCGLID